MYQLVSLLLPEELGCKAVRYCKKKRRGAWVGGGIRAHLAALDLLAFTSRAGSGDGEPRREEEALYVWERRCVLQLISLRGHSRAGHPTGECGGPAAWDGPGVAQPGKTFQSLSRIKRALGRETGPQKQEMYHEQALCAVLSRSVAADSLWFWSVVGQTTSMGIARARILKCVTLPSSRESSQPRDRNQVSRVALEFFTIWDTRETLEYRSGYPFSRGTSNPGMPPNQGLLHCRWILYVLSNREAH